MQIDRVTITGADDSTDIEWMLDMSRRYPFVEWGILTSASQRGSARFLSLKWMHALSFLINRQPDVRLSLHVCGAWVREICKGNWTPLIAHHDRLLDKYRRVQLNFHAYTHLLTDDFCALARAHCERFNWQLIFQVDGVNDHLAYTAFANGVDAVPLFDKSGGAGVIPDQWPAQMAGVYSGYAGGLGPDNVLDEIEKIRQVASGTVWIDMERRVRVDDDSALDIVAVESVLKQVQAAEAQWEVKQ